MSKRVDRRRREKNSSKSIRTSVPARSAAIDAGGVDDRLARLLDTPHLAQIVPRLPPEALYHLIQHRGLDACGALLAAATSEQVASILDLDLWRAPSPGDNRQHDQFDDRRFGLWLETLMDEGEGIAARVIAAMDPALATVGLSRYVCVLDPAVLSLIPSSDNDLERVDVSPSGSVESEIGGYVVRARTTDSWDAIVGLLVTLAAEYPDCFHRLMRGCRRLSNSVPEADGLDNLLLEPEQLLHDAAVERDDRRSQRGYLTAADARSFLEMARRPAGSHDSSINAIATAYFRALDDTPESTSHGVRPEELSAELPTDASVSQSIDAVVDLLVQAGITSGQPRALLGPAPAAADPKARSVTPIQRLMECLEESDQPAYFARSRELGFVANALLGGCSMHFTAEQAWNAAVGICNVALEVWPARWPDMTVEQASTADSPAGLPATFLIDHDVLTAFKVGWRLLHEEVSVFVAERLIATLSHLRSVDREIERDLRRLRRELERHRDAPWQAREALEVIAILDTPAWAALGGLLSECPVWPAALTALLERHAGSVSATAFECFTTKTQILKVREFVERLPGLLLQ
jgi:hypothetical protein